MSQTGDDIAAEVERLHRIEEAARKASAALDQVIREDGLPKESYGWLWDADDALRAALEEK